ncbi:hypothetical protein D3M61_02635 [Aliarcobacter butzleri]|uniref:hypothetical protein n=1 Tax=Aliarcobacter butzleri TaxID=28197 RepID=UPI00102DE1CB|nr:hypothetical protein [Aliarcobacter butzleri]RZV14875.1 hypothetical protein D3M61_02635 [Aliarcobacter butzleri]
MWNKVTLENELKKRGINQDSYSLDESEGYYVDETYCLREVYGEWIVFSTERGEYIGEKKFKSENEACEYFLNWISGDRTVYNKV